MALPLLNPHPFGCPLGLLVRPSEMRTVARRLVQRLSDLVVPTVHEIRPRKGQAYPLLNLHVPGADGPPRVVFFPGWESDSASEASRIGYGRQTELLQRIAGQGLVGEGLSAESELEPSDRTLVLSLAAGTSEIETLAYDLYDALGDRLRWTITLAGPGGGAWPILRAYSPFDPGNPRLILVPGWRTGRPSAGLGADARRALVASLGNFAETEVEDHLERTLF